MNIRGSSVLHILLLSPPQPLKSESYIDFITISTSISAFISLPATRWNNIKDDYIGIFCLCAPSVHADIIASFVRHLPTSKRHLKVGD